MSREYLKQEYRKAIKNQLAQQDPMKTVIVYHHLLEIGYDESRAVDALAYQLEMMLLDMLSENKNFDEEVWNRNLDELMKEEEKDVVLNAYQLEKVEGRLRKEYGYIAHGEEDYYLDGLNLYENNLKSLAQRHQLNSRELKKIVEMWMYFLYGSLHDTTYDFSKVADEDLIGMAKMLDYNSNILHNETLFEKIKKEHPDLDFSLRENLDRVFKMSFLLLGRIYESMRFWEKELGSDGYLSYLKQIGEFDVEDDI
ncbi:hypothetical protein [[Eubacterium] hominis]|uniref:hypothetical protein n=1 Tax=[Eubacterium] hominis TaxID=2764325 RepID=UPI003A4D6196